MTCKEPVDDFWVKDFNECIGLSDRLPATQETKGYDLSPYADELPLCEVGIHSPRRWSFMQLVGAAVLTQSGAKDLDPGMVGNGGSCWSTCQGSGAPGHVVAVGCLRLQAVPKRRTEAWVRRSMHKVLQSCLTLRARARLAFDFDEIRPGHPGVATASPCILSLTFLASWHCWLRSLRQSTDQGPLPETCP